MANNSYIAKTYLANILYTITNFLCGGLCIVMANSGLYSDGDVFGLWWGCVCFIGLGLCVVYNTIATKRQNAKRK